MYKILIIEDDEIVAEIYKDKLEAEGYCVAVEHDGEAGYLKLQAFKPDLLLLDMILPSLTGAEILAMLRREDEFKDLPIIAFSGSDEVLKEAKRLGASRVLSRGEYIPNQIVARITEVLATLPKRYEELSMESLGDWKPSTGRVLVVEDDPIMLALVKDVIEEEGYSVVSAHDGREAYKLLERDSEFVAGIFDVKMPFLLGTDLIRYMQTEKRLARIPVLIMTIQQSPEVQHESLSAGAAVFLPKPFTRSSLRTMFRVLVAGMKKETHPLGVKVECAV